MKLFLLIALIFSAFGLAIGQTGQVPIVSREFAYQDWTHNNLDGEGRTNLRQFASGKKLVMVVYWMAWCPDWRLDAGFVQQLHEDYGDKGLGIIGVGLYDTLPNMRAHVSRLGLSFPMVYESDSRADRDRTQHFRQRREAGDTRLWGTPLYVFLDPKALEPKGDILTNRPDLVIGELRRDDTERYIREKLGLSDNARGQ